MVDFKTTSRVHGAIPATAGIGLRAEHYRDIVDGLPSIGWLEVHSENYFGSGGPALRYLTAIRRDYPVSLHGVGLSIGSTDPLDRRHLDRLKHLIGLIEPGLISEHLSWSQFGGTYFNDLLPLPYTEEALDHMVDRVHWVQEILGRQILIENPSSYLEFLHSTLPEWEFLTELARRSGCGLLLDVNNLFVSACNLGWDPLRYLAGIPAGRVAEIHLAGHTRKPFDDGEILIDTHDGPACEAVWKLYAETLRRMGPKPALIEWDTNLPRFDVLLDEARRADSVLEASHARAA